MACTAIVFAYPCRVRERRRSLTPLESELRPSHAPIADKPSAIERLRWRRAKRVPTTLRGAILHGLTRLGIAVAVASGIALALDHWVDRGTAFGFYIVGAAVLAVAFGMSAAPIRTPYYYRQGDRELRVRMSFSYILAGAIVIAIGAAIELL
jgi:hypothetical protein